MHLSSNEYYKSIDGNLYTADGAVLIQYVIGKREAAFKIPDTVTTIEAYAFSECVNLTSLVIGNGVASIKDHAFEECRSLTNIVVGDGVTSIGGAAFLGCDSLTSVVIGDRVTSIGGKAFDLCLSLKDVYYKGTKEDKANVEIGISDAYFILANWYYYVENEADVPTDGGNYWHYDANGEIAVWQ